MPVFGSPPGESVPDDATVMRGAYRQLRDAERTRAARPSPAGFPPHRGDLLDALEAGESVRLPRYMFGRAAAEFPWPPDVVTAVRITADDVVSPVTQVDYPKSDGTDPCEILAQGRRQSRSCVRQAGKCGHSGSSSST